jgi:hypothetical protein
MLLLFACGFILVYYGLSEAKIIMTEDQHRGISFIAGLALAAVGKQHT